MSPRQLRLLALAAATNTLVIAAPIMSLTVLFPEIAADLRLDLVQVGLIWGFTALPGIFTSLAGGALGDRFGPKRMIRLGCLGVAVAGAARGLAVDLGGLAVAVVMLGLLAPLVSLNVFKICGVWFPPRQLGRVNGVLSMGMAFGFLLGAGLSATVLSPALGGWRAVMFGYGAVAGRISLPWALAPAAAPGGAPPGLSMRQALRQVAGRRNLWWLGLALFGISGGVQSMLGYLPLYLRGLGWSAGQAAGAVAAFHTVSLLCVLPITAWSDRRRYRKGLLMGAGVLIAIGIGWLAVAADGWVLAAVLMAGSVRDSFMAVFLTMIVETEGVGPAFAGTATGLVMVLGGLGGWLAPPLGNSLAAMGPGVPFLFWAGLCAAGLLSLALTREAQALAPPLSAEPDRRG